MPHPLNEQVIVITGASSGIGRLAALKLGREGATVVLAARNEAALREIAAEVQASGGRALVVQTDVSVPAEMKQLADTTFETYGRIDTWVNNAGTSIYASVESTTIEEYERLTKVNYLGQVYGVKAALPHMIAQTYGTIVNVGSIESMRSLPLQSAYAASKHAVKGFTEALRMEMERFYPNIRVTLILPAAMNTPLFNHARSKMGVKPLPVPPIYKPEVGADAIVHAAKYAPRDIYVGGGGFLFSLMQRLSPAMMDRIMVTGGLMWKLQKTQEPDDNRDNLYAPMEGSARIEGDFSKWAKASMFSRLFEFSPPWQRLALPLLLVGAAGILRRR